MWSDIGKSYGVGWRFAFAFPLIFLLPSAVEFIQHVIEWRIGMFDSIAQADALAQHPARIGFGSVKLAALSWIGIWVSRFLHSGGDRAFTRAVSGRLMLAFVPVVLVSLAWDAGQQALGPWTNAAALGKVGSFAAGLGIFLFSAVLQVLLAGWRVGVPLRDRRMGFLSSIAKGLRVLPAGVAIHFAVFLPLLVVHTALNVAMVFAGPGPALWGLFVVDSLLVGYIAVAIWGVMHAIYRRGLSRAGLEPLLADQERSSR